MANLCGASLQCVAIRVTELDAGGKALPGNVMYVTDNLVKIDFNPEMESGQEINTKNAAGNLCVVYQSPDLMKRLNLSVEVCVPDPELEVLLSGGDLFLEGTEVQGFSYPPLMVDSNPNGVSIEAWTRYVVDGYQPAEQPYMWWTFPKAKLGKGNRTIDVNAMGNVYDGFAIENPEWDNGPMGDWLWPSDRVVQVCFTDTVPTVQCGAQEVPPLAVTAADGATAGAPGLWTPQGSNPPANVAALIAGTPNVVVASPTTAWTTGQYVQTGTSGAAGEAHWDGAAWVAGKAA
jgi:hypothetical protein